MGRLMKSQEFGVKKLHVQRRSTGEGASFAAADVKNKNPLMEIVLDDAGDPVGHTDTAIVESALRKYRRTFQYLFQELPDHPD